MSPAARFVCVGGDRFVGDEVQIAFDGKSELAAAPSRKGRRRDRVAVELTAFDSPSPGEYMGEVARVFEEIAKSRRTDRGPMFCLGRC
jgi:hypothetical protein